MPVGTCGVADGLSVVEPPERKGAQTVRVSVRYFQQQKEQGIPIVMLTAYDATMARIAEQAGVQVLLVGDTLGMVVQGHDTTVPVTLDEMLYHTRLVVRGTERAFIVGDLPFMTYNISSDQALANAARLLQQAGAQSVKLEGGRHMAPTIHRLVENGIPVMAHIGLTPQSVHQLGGWRVQGRTKAAAARLLDDAQAVAEAGAYAVVLELVPAELAALISQRVPIPTIGIGAGPGCDGQVQVVHDILGLFEAFVPRHTHQYAKLGEAMRAAIATYKTEVEQRLFPTPAHAASMDADLLSDV
jgi:3-methyl-2-oxobutanoate hydroxymethyltransferase